MAGEAEREERRWEALWSYRANPPIVQAGRGTQVVDFQTFLAQLGLDEDKAEPPEISDEEIERIMKRGRMRLFPPGTGDAK